MKTLSSYILLILPVFLVVTASSVSAKDGKDWTLDLKTSTLIPKYVGSVKEIKGDVMVEDRVLQKGSKIYPRDTLKTQDKSFIKLELLDDTIITLGPKSEFIVESWIYKTKNDREAVFALMKGKLRAEIKSKSKEKDQLKVRSPLVAMGIRGTELTMNNNFVGNKEITQVALLEGRIQVLIGELKEKLDMKPGDYIEIVKGISRTKHKAKVLQDDEFKELKTKQLPDQYNLMRDAVLDPDLDSDAESSETSDETSKDYSDELINAETTPQSAMNKVKIKPASLKEKIRILNEVREKNMKE